MKREGIDHDEVKPWNWATLTGRSKPVEILSYPIPNGDKPDTIMVRLTIGDPTTLREVPLSAIAAFSPDRHEDYIDYCNKTRRPEHG